MTINIGAVVACTVAAFILSSVWYMVFSKARATMLKLNLEEERKPKPQNIALELLRTFVLALLFAIILSKQATNSLGESLQLGLLLWLAFPAILLSGSVMWDKVPARLAAIHAGDWLIKILLIAVIIGAWR